MIKVIIADDDSLVRIGLKSIINWEENGFELAGEASDGSKALDLVARLNPDIIITDIKMPVMDGIELIRKLSELKRKPRILALSSYNEFQLVKEAMRLGAEDYLLKLEINPESLIDTLKRIAHDIEEDQQDAAERFNIDHQIHKNLNMMRRNFLRDVLGNFYTSQEDLKESMEFLKISLNSDYIYCFLIKVGELYRFEDVPEDELYLLNFSIINISEEIADDLFNAYCFEMKTGEFFLVASGKKYPDSPVGKRELIALGERLKDMLQLYLNITVTIGIGEGKGGVKGIRDSYDRALGAVKTRFFKENDRVILWNDVKSSTFLNEDYSIIGMRDRLHSAMSLHSKAELEGIFKTVQKYLSELPLSKNAICNIMLELFYMINEFFELYQINAREVMKKSFNTYQQLVHMENISDARKWINEVLEDMTGYIGREDEVSYKRIIASSLGYIKSHFTEDISLREVADRVNLNPSYFSTILKKYTGMSYSEHITQARIDKAKSLLLKSDYKVYEIGERVGYQNVYYFDKIFKKVTGLSPSEYKNSI